MISTCVDSGAKLRTVNSACWASSRKGRGCREVMKELGCDALR